MSESGLLANHENASGLRCPSTGTRAEGLFEPVPLPKRKTVSVVREVEGPRNRRKREKVFAPLPQIPTMRPRYWAPRPKPVPFWKPAGFVSYEAWREHIEKMYPPEPAYVPKLPRFRIVSGGLPGLGRRR